MSNFTAIAPRYQRTSTVQQSAGERLLELASLVGTEDVLDLGCGTGQITSLIRSRTKGLVMGVDPSAGMIAEARRNHGEGIDFRVDSAETLATTQRFDAVVCNSAFQWFRDPRRALANCRKVLRPGGRIAIQAPARSDYCPAFTRAAAALGSDLRTRDVFSRFRSPWFFLETAEDYARLANDAGFVVRSSWIDTVTQRCPPAKVLEVFDSGAAAGYLNPDFYDVPLPSDYTPNARAVITSSFASQSHDDGLVDLTFFRIYLLAERR